MTSGSITRPAQSTTVLATAATLPDQLADWAARHADAVSITFLDYRERQSGQRTSLTWQQLHESVDAVAALVQTRVQHGDRVAIMADQTPDYVAAFLGVLRAGGVAVPLFGPDLPGHANRLAAVLADSDAVLALTTQAEKTGAAEFLAQHGLSRVAVTTVDDAPRITPKPVELCADDLAYLQYTSGSTGTPRGVMITHGNVVANARQANTAYGVTRGRGVTVSWLPLFHDMGLMLSVAGPVVGGTRSVLMQPMAFLHQPQRWLHALSANPGAITAAPSFAYAYAAARVSDEDKARLRLDTVHALVDGSEPVQPAMIEKFRAAFAPCGLRRDVHRPSYGLAEATVFVTAGTASDVAAGRAFHRGALALGRLVESPSGAPDTVELVSCGQSVGQDVLIVDTATTCEAPDGAVGEIWVQGPNVALGYWNRPHETEERFGARLAGRPDRGTWLRTGDLGARLRGELYVTGRIKDLIIVDGRNHYPQDVEQTVEQAHAAVRPRNSVAFPVDTPDGERAVVLAERNRRMTADQVDPAEVAATVRAAVAKRHGLALHDMRVVDPGSLPRTSSGKIARSACRAGYLAARS